MLVAKQVADLITYSRALLGIGLAWLGVVHGPDGLVLAVWAMILDWSGDSVDGVIARRSRPYYRTWIGDHDLQVDMLVSFGLLVYMLGAGYWGVWAGSVYLLVWLLVFWRWGIYTSLGMLFQAPIYGWFIWISLQEQPAVGRWMVVWIAFAVVVTWPKFPNMVVPGFLSGMRTAWLGIKGEDKTKS